MFTTILLSAVIAPAVVLAHPATRVSTKKACAPLDGDFIINNFKLYPENADWDPVNCKLYAGSNYNATVLVYDPYTGAQEILEFPGISYNPDYHVSGVDYDPYSASFYFSANTPVPYESQGANLTGPNRLIRYNPSKKKVVWNIDFAPYQDALATRIGVRGSGFQDTAADNKGNAYGTLGYGNAVVKVCPNGNVEPFYETPAAQVNGSALGYGGLVTVNKGRTIIVADALSGTFQKIETQKAGPVTAAAIPITGQPEGYKLACDGLLAPALYDQSVLLCSEDFYGGTAGSITVFQTTDGWKSGKYVGQIDNAAVGGEQVTGAVPVATVQIVDRLYILEEYFFDQGFPIVGPGNRTAFPVIDITQEVADLVS